MSTLAAGRQSLAKVAGIGPKSTPPRRPNAPAGGPKPKG
jgi:hypothetical protein